MRKLLFLVLLLCYLVTGCQSKESLPEFSVPIEIADNRPFVAVKIKEKTFHFVVDTGGYNSIETEIAKELNLNLANKFQMPGAGEKTVDAWTTTIDSFSIGEKSFTNRKFFALPLKEIKENLKLPYLDGIIGYDFFGDSVLQLDYPNKKVSFLSKFEGKTGVPFSIYGSHIPQISVEIDGIKSAFVIDTGDRSQLTLGQKFSEQVLAKNSYQLSEEKITGYGLGGAIMARTFELKSLKFGAVEAKNVLTRIPNLKGGVFAQSDFKGSIGSGLLKNYKVTFDYRNKVFFIG
jgi:hypothetical protein